MSGGSDCFGLCSKGVVEDCLGSDSVRINDWLFLKPAIKMDEGVVTEINDWLGVELGGELGDWLELVLRGEYGDMLDEELEVGMDVLGVGLVEGRVAGVGDVLCFMLGVWLDVELLRVGVVLWFARFSGLNVLMELEFSVKFFGALFTYHPDWLRFGVLPTVNTSVSEPTSLCLVCIMRSLFRETWKLVFSFVDLVTDCFALSDNEFFKDGEEIFLVEVKGEITLLVVSEGLTRISLDDNLTLLSQESKLLWSSLP